MDQNGSNLIQFDQSSTFYKFLIINLLDLDNNKMMIFFWSDSIRSVQIGSNLIKLDQSSTFYKILIINLLAQNGYLLLIRFDQICPNWIKLDQTWSINLFLLDNKYGHLFWIRFDQIRSNLIKLNQMWISHLSKNVNIKSCHNYHENKCPKKHLFSYLCFRRLVLLSTL